MVFHPAGSPGIDVNRGLTIHENVILDKTVPAAANERRPPGTVEDVPYDGDSACRIIQIHGHSAVKARTFDIVKVIIAYNRSSRRPVATHIKGPDITGLEADMMYLVELNGVIVAAELDCIVGTVMNHIVRNVIADAVHRDGRPVSSIDAPEVMNVIIPCAVSCGRQGLTLASVQGHAAFSGPIDITAKYRVFAAA
jgi:hypothetical protein